MRWLADENLPRAIVEFLRGMGEDVVAIAEVAPGIPDEEVIRIARDTGRMLVSFDRDHGDLIFGRALPPPIAVIYLRLEPPLPQVLNTLLASVAAMGEAVLIGQFTVVGQNGTRQRALPRN